MRPFVGVAADLAPVSATLRERGYDVVDLPAGGPEDAHGLDVVVVSGESAGMLGIWRAQPPVPVVDADGKTPDEVAEQVDSALARRRQD